MYDKFIFFFNVIINSFKLNTKLTKIVKPMTQLAINTLTTKEGKKRMRNK